MEKKKYISYILWAFLIGLILYGAWFAYTSIRENEKILSTDVTEIIPADTDYILRLHGKKLSYDTYKRYENFLSLLPDNSLTPFLESICQARESTCTFIKEDILISYYEEGSVIFSKMKPDDFRMLEKNLFCAIFSPFASKKEKYKGIPVFLRSTSGDDFFCYTYFNHIFAGSYNVDILHRLIDSFRNGTVLKNDIPFQKAYYLNKENNTPADIFINPEKLNRVTLPGEQQANGLINLDVQLNTEDLYLTGISPLPAKGDSLSFFSQKSFLLPDADYFRYINSNFLPDIATTSLTHEDSLLLAYADKGISYCRFSEKEFPESPKEIIYFLTDTKELRNDIIRSFSGKNKGLRFNRVYNSRGEKFPYAAYTADFNILTLFSGTEETESMSFLTFFGEYVLISKDKETAKSFIQAAEKGEREKENTEFFSLWEKYWNKHVRQLIWEKSCYNETNPSFHFNHLVLYSDTGEGELTEYIIRQKQTL